MCQRLLQSFCGVGISTNLSWFHARKSMQSLQSQKRIFQSYEIYILTTFRNLSLHPQHQSHLIPFSFFTTQSFCKMPRGSGSSSSGTNSQGNTYNTPGGTNSGSSAYHCRLTMMRVLLASCEHFTL